MAIVEFPMLMNDYCVWLDKPDYNDGFNMDVWMAEYQLKVMVWENDDILLLIEEFDCSLLVEV